jgi:predicted site-specific integrase-resolvase
MEQSKLQRCAIYTRKSSEEGLEQEFNSLHAQREACEAFIKSQAGEGWRLIKTAYDDGGLSGATMERPALQRLMADIKQGLINVVVVYKVDRLTRSLADFVKMVEAFDAHGVSFVSVTQQFNTTTSMGRLTLNVLLSFAQFERDVDNLLRVYEYKAQLWRTTTEKDLPALTEFIAGAWETRDSEQTYMKILRPEGSSAAAQNVNTGVSSVPAREAS